MVGWLLTVSSWWVLALGHGRETEQGQGAEQICSSSEPRGDGGCLGWGQDWRPGGWGGAGPESALASSSPDRL